MPPKPKTKKAAKTKAKATESAVRVVYVFWHSSHDPQNNAELYCACVKNSPARQDGCDVRCRLVDLALQPPDPAAKHASGNTIEVVSVKDDQKVGSLLNPSFSCTEINDLVDELCQ